MVDNVLGQLRVRIVRDSVTNLPKLEVRTESGALIDSNSAILSGLNVAGDAAQDAKNKVTYTQRSQVVLAADQLRAALDIGVQSVGIGVITDSTAASSARWSYLLGQKIGAKYPSYTVQWWLWDDTNQDYFRPQVIQTGAGGARYSTAAASSYAFQADSAQNSITGDIDVRICVALDSWTVPGEACFVSKFGGAGQRSFRFSYGSGFTNKLLMEVTTDGTTLISANPTVAYTPPADGAIAWLRATRVSSTGVVAFYTSTDGNTWTQLGANVNGTSGAIFDSTTELQVNGRGGSGAAGNGFAGKVYEVQVRNGISGNVVAPILVEHWDNQTSAGTLRQSWPTGGAPVLNVINGARSGADITYLADTTRLPKLLLNAGQKVVIAGCSHNDAGRLGQANLLSYWDTLLSYVGTYLPRANFAAQGENPRTSPAVNITDHAMRQHEIAGWARKNNVGFIDIYRPFVADSRGLASLVNNDGIHPSDATGSPLWASTTYAALGLA
jgi:lysophospholipase L1-like esterase